MASGTLARRDEPMDIYDQFRVLDMYASNLTALAGAFHIGLRTLWSHFTALEKQVKEISQQNKSYAEYVEKLQINNCDLAEQLRQSKLREGYLQAELQYERAASRRSATRRQRRSGKKQRSS